MIVENSPVALLGLRPLGFLPLTTPLPRTHYWLALLSKAFAVTVVCCIDDWWVSTTVSWACPRLKSLKQGSVKVEAIGTFFLTVSNGQVVVHRQILDDR